jgi:Cu2+-exporting ATPase
MFLLSGLTFLLSGQLGRAISILIVDFGTGVRIALPTTMLTTMIGGARHGILFKNGQSIDTLARIDTVVFDKTGTLTTGRPVVVDVVPEAGSDPVQALRLAASAEGHLPHPLARAVRRAARKAGLELSPPDSVHYLPGGVEAMVEGHAVLVGEPRFLERKGLQRPRDETAESSVALVAVDGRLAARIRFRDSVRESARAAVKGLRALGISELVLATGDHPAAAQAVAHQLHLDECHGGLMPEDKVKLVESLREQGRFVAVVGDGINDAAAMAAANVGIAVPRGADLARETAEVLLLEEDLGSAVAAIRLARAANEIVRENIGLVAMPNAIGLSLAMLGRLNPLTATIVNNGSTILAAANALRPLRGHQVIELP